MRVFGFEIQRARAKMLSAVPTNGGGWFDVVRESFAGAWQSNIAIDSGRDVLAFSAVFACVTRIAGDIAKLRIKLTQEGADGICTEVTDSPFLKILQKQNNFQTRINFVENWVLSKLLKGNAYALKGREGRTMVNRAYILDPARVTPLVSPSGDVYYRLNTDHLAGLTESVTVPASEIMHDRMNCLWHPLVGVSPLYAAGVSATQGRRIQRNSTKFFDNMSRPSGLLVAPGSISDENALRLKKQWEENFRGENVGRTAVLGDGLKYEAMTIPATDAQLIEQLKWTVEDVARCFGVPFFKVGGPVPVQTSIEALNQIYYSDCLQTLIEALELCLDEGLEVPDNYYTEFDLDGLLRMDASAQMTALAESVKGGIRAPNEARKKINLPPIAGGDAVYLQQQNYSTEALAKRDALADPFATSKSAPAAPAANDPAMEEAAAMADEFIRGLKEDVIHV